MLCRHSRRNEGGVRCVLQEPWRCNLSRGKGVLTQIWAGAKWYDWLNEERWSCCTCSTHFSAFLWRNLSNDDVKFWNLRFWWQLEPVAVNLSLGSFSIDDGDGNDNTTNKQFHWSSEENERAARVARTYEQVLAILCKTTTWNYNVYRFDDNLSIQLYSFNFLYL